jgi:hypothetical protein
MEKKDDLDEKASPPKRQIVINLEREEDEPKTKKLAEETPRKLTTQSPNEKKSSSISSVSPTKKIDLLSFYKGDKSMVAKAMGVSGGFTQTKIVENCMLEGIYLSDHDKKYEVIVEMKDWKEVIDCTCSCGDHRTLCKHVGGLVQAWMMNPATFKKVDDVL